MNTLPNYTLAARPESGRMLLRGWAALSSGTFSGAIFLTDIALIVAMSCLTGVAYHLAAYGDRGNVAEFVQVGVLAALAGVLAARSPSKHAARLDVLRAVASE